MKRYSCLKCSVTFYDKFSLRKHLDTHKVDDVLSEDDLEAVEITQPVRHVASPSTLRVRSISRNKRNRGEMEKSDESTNVNKERGRTGYHLHNQPPSESENLGTAPYTPPLKKKVSSFISFSNYDIQ